MKAGAFKVANRGKLTANEVNARIEVIIVQAIQQEGVFNIFAATNQTNLEILILSDEYMNSNKNMKHKNIAAEMLRKLLYDNIKVLKLGVKPTTTMQGWVRSTSRLKIKYLAILRNNEIQRVQGVYFIGEIS